jgi:hypothetical protein
MARKSVAPSTYRVRVPRDGPTATRSLAPSREAARTRFSRQASLARKCRLNSLPAWLYLRRGSVSATLTMFSTRHIKQAIQSYPSRVAKIRYNVEVAGCKNPWADSMRPYMQRLLGTDRLGTKTLVLLTASWAKSTADTYMSAIKPYFEFCEEHDIHRRYYNCHRAIHCMHWCTRHHQGNESTNLPLGRVRVLQEPRR